MTPSVAIVLVTYYGTRYLERLWASLQAQAYPRERWQLIVVENGPDGSAAAWLRERAPGARVLVPGPNGLMQSATVRQLLQGYYELEVGGSGETIWVPINGVVPE